MASEAANENDPREVEFSRQVVRETLSQEVSNELTTVSSPTAPRRSVVAVLGVAVVIIVAVVLLGTLVPRYMSNKDREAEKIKSKEELFKEGKGTIGSSHGSLVKIRPSAETVTSYPAKTSRSFDLGSSSETTSDISRVSLAKVASSSSSNSDLAGGSSPQLNPSSSAASAFSSALASPSRLASSSNTPGDFSTTSISEQPLTSQNDGYSVTIVVSTKRSTVAASLSSIAGLVPNLEAKWSRWNFWSDCTKTCGGGTRVRTRKCLAQNQRAVFAPISCAGKLQQNKTCADWSCPDCNRNCTTGTLNAACDACTCAHHVLTGRVLTESDVPLSEANISLADTPYNVLAQTNISGFFTVHGVCTDQQELLITQAGFVPLRKVATIPLTVKLENAVPPSVTVHPSSKIRLPGQNVTFCCDGEGNPPPDIEWFKDGNIIDQELYGYNKTIDISDVSGLGGSYRCRVVNDFGSEFSDPADLEVLDSSQASCNATPISRNITLPPGCVLQGTNNSFVDVGDCAPSRCLQNDSAILNTCQDQIFCCGVKEMADMKVDCGDFATFNISKVTSCGCGHCSEPTTVISGVVVGGTKEQPIRLGSIKVDGKEIGVTDFQGSFSFKISEGRKRIAVTFTDSWFEDFEDVTRVFRVENGQTVFKKIVMKEKQAPLLFNSSKPLQVPLGDIPGQLAFADLEIPEGALLNEDGTMHEGDANLRLSVMDPRNESDILSAPGDFSAVDEDGEEQILQTYGMLNLNFEDSSGKRLAMSKPMKVYLDPDELNITTDNNGNTTAKLWWLDEKTGRWMQAGDIWMEEKGSNRSRRADQRRFLVTEITPAIQRGPLNFDIVREKCRVRVSAPPQSTIRLMCLESPTSAKFLGYLEDSSNKYGVTCINAWRDKVCYLQAEGKDSLFLEPNQVRNSFPVDVAVKIVESKIGTGSKKIRSFKFVTSVKSKGPVYSYYRGRSNCQRSSLGSQYEQFRFGAPNQSLPTFTMETVKNEGNPRLPSYWYSMNVFSDPLQYEVCFIKVRVHGKKAVFLASSYRGEKYDDEKNGRLGDFATIALDSNERDIYVACLKIRCPGYVMDGRNRIEERTDVRITPLNRHCHFLNVSIPQVFLKGGKNGQELSCNLPPIDGNHQKWICVPPRSKGNLKSYFTYQAEFKKPDEAKKKCLAGDNTLGSFQSTPVVTIDVPQVDYTCS